MKFIIAFLTYLPVVLAAVKAIEIAAQGVPGESKKALIMNAVQAANEAGQAVPNTDVQAISALVDYSVKAFNTAGVFTKASSPVSVQ